MCKFPTHSETKLVGRVHSARIIDYDEVSPTSDLLSSSYPPSAPPDASEVPAPAEEARITRGVKRSLSMSSLSSRSQDVPDEFATPNQIVLSAYYISLQSRTRHYGSSKFSVHLTARVFRT